MTLPGQPSLTVLITYFQPARVKHADAQVRNVLRCRFVQKVIVSSHNPDLRAETIVRARDPRLVLVNTEERRGCAHRWSIAGVYEPEHLLVIDDDVLLRSSQVARLFQHLVVHPEVPHGLSGMRQWESGYLEFVDRRSLDVDYLCEVYALTRRQLQRYADLRACITDARVADLVDNALDFVVVSQTGSGRPRIHDLGHLLRCETFKQPGVAVHQVEGFDAHVRQVVESLGRSRSLNPPAAASEWPPRVSPRR